MAVLCLVSSVSCLMSTVYCLLSNVYCLLSTVYCLTSTVYCPLSTVTVCVSSWFVFHHTLKRGKGKFFPKVLDRQIDIHTDRQTDRQTYQQTSRLLELLRAAPNCDYLLFKQGNVCRLLNLGLTPYIGPLCPPPLFLVFGALAGLTHLSSAPRLASAFFIL